MVCIRAVIKVTLGKPAGFARTGGAAAIDPLRTSAYGSPP